jgi:hypothetical protein
VDVEERRTTFGPAFFVRARFGDFSTPWIEAWKLARFVGAFLIWRASGRPSAAKIGRCACTGPANTHFAGQPDRRNTAPVLARAGASLKGRLCPDDRAGRGRRGPGAQGAPAHAPARPRLRAADKGHDTGAIQGWLGHRSITSTAVFTALAPNRFKDFWRDRSSRCRGRGALGPAPIRRRRPRTSLCVPADIGKVSIPRVPARRPHNKDGGANAMADMVPRGASNQECANAREP